LSRRDGITLKSIRDTQWGSQAFWRLVPWGVRSGSEISACRRQTRRVTAPTSLRCPRGPARRRRNRVHKVLSARSRRSAYYVYHIKLERKAGTGAAGVSRRRGRGVSALPRAGRLKAWGRLRLAPAAMRQPLWPR